MMYDDWWENMIDQGAECDFMGKLFFILYDCFLGCTGDGCQKLYKLLFDLEFCYITVMI